MLERSPYPLLTLKLLGTLCPCLEKEEDSAARRAAWSLSSTHVRWHRSNNTTAGNETNANAWSIKGIFGGGSSSDGMMGGGTTESVNGAVLSIIDARGGPQFVMSPPPGQATEIGKKRVPLRMVKTIRLAGSGIDIILDNNDTVFRFDVLKPLQIPRDEDGDDEEEGPATFDDADDATRNETMVQLQLLVEWERRRQTRLLTLGIAEDESAEDIVDESSSSPKRGGMIADKARQVQHFAQREIEMKKQKRDREARKAKYVQGAGGLKYTAIAMANRS
ncbi:hypothetical protein ACHAWT_001343 [Skeletonema menzelii]